MFGQQSCTSKSWRQLPRTFLLFVEVLLFVEAPATGIGVAVHFLNTGTFCRQLSSKAIPPKGA